MAKKKKVIRKKAVKKAKKARKAAPKRKAVRRSASRKAAAKKKVATAKPKKAAAPQAPVLPWRVPREGETKLGMVQDYYGHIGVLIVTLEQPLKVGDKIRVHGHTTDLTQVVESIQINHESVPQAGPNNVIGVKVGDKCRKGDYVYLCAA